MSPTSNSTITNLLLLATISSSAVCLTYDASGLIPAMEHKYDIAENIADWNENAFNKLPTYSAQDEEKYQAIIGFSQRILTNTADIDSEFVDIVNENFWDLL